MNLHFGFNYSGGKGMSWMEWEEKLRLRMVRAQFPIFPESVKWPIWKSMADFIESELFSGTNTPRSQYQYWINSGKKRGMYGTGSPTSGQPDHVINAWENLGGDDEIKRTISMHPENEDVASMKGPPFLRSMRAMGPVDWSQPYTGAIGVHTQATMTPYDRTAGTTKPIMHYLVHGWRGNRAFMRPRWPDGAAIFVALAKPYIPYMTLISRYIIQGV